MLRFTYKAIPYSFFLQAGHEKLELRNDLNYLKRKTGRSLTITAKVERMMIYLYHLSPERNDYRYP